MDMEQNIQSDNCTEDNKEIVNISQGDEELDMDVDRADKYDGDDRDDGEDDGREEEIDNQPTKVTKTRKPRSYLTGRGVTLLMLIEDGVMEPGEKLLSIDYLGQKFQADLLPDGKIKWPEADKQFNSPSAWAIYCKRLVNPSKKSGCGWASVKYKGRKLDQYKTTWFKKQRTGSSAQSTPKFLSPPSLSSQPPSNNTTITPASSTATSTITSPLSTALHEKDNTGPPKPVTHRGRGPSRKSGRPSGRPRLKSPSGTHTQGIRKITSPSLTASSLSLQNNHSSFHIKPSSNVTSPIMRSVQGPLIKSPTSAHDLPLSSPPLSAGRKRSVRTRMSVKHSSVTPDGDPHTLVELVGFTSTGKMQPFSMDISTNSLVLVDYHCHLTTSEVTGYLAGKWDPQTHHIKILQAFPCRCRFADKENAPKVEEEIRQAVSKRGLQIVGWYHSHPSYQADPSLQDIKSQTKYQKMAKQALGETNEPVIGMIVSPYDNYKPTKESTFRAFWVMTPPDSNPEVLGIPMHLNFTIQQDQFLTQDLLNELRWLWSFYKGSPDAIEFSHAWYGQQTYMDKVKCSLIKKFPSDQADGRFIEFINTLLG